MDSKVIGSILEGLSIKSIINEDIQSDVLGYINKRTGGDGTESSKDVLILADMSGSMVPHTIKAVVKLSKVLSDLNIKGKFHLITWGSSDIEDLDRDYSVVGDPKQLKVPGGSGGYGSSDIDTALLFFEKKSSIKANLAFSISDGSFHKVEGKSKMLIKKLNVMWLVPKAYDSAGLSALDPTAKSEGRITFI